MVSLADRSDHLSAEQAHPQPPLCPTSCLAGSTSVTQSPCVRMFVPLSPRGGSICGLNAALLGLAVRQVWEPQCHPCPSPLHTHGLTLFPNQTSCCCGGFLITETQTFNTQIQRRIPTLCKANVCDVPGTAFVADGQLSPTHQELPLPPHHELWKFL